MFKRKRERRSRVPDLYELHELAKTQFVCASASSWPVSIPANWHWVAELREAREWLEHKREERAELLWTTEDEWIAGGSAAMMT